MFLLRNVPHSRSSGSRTTSKLASIASVSGCRSCGGVQQQHQPTAPQSQRRRAQSTYTWLARAPPPPSLLTPNRSLYQHRTPTAWFHANAGGSAGGGVNDTPPPPPPPPAVLVDPPRKARVVICGGGVMGAAVAYHLALAGWGEHTVLMEQSYINSTSSWHSSGLVGAFKPTFSQVCLAQQSIQLLDDLTQRGLPTGWKQCGSLNLARTRDRMTVFRRMKSQSVGWGIDCELLSAAQCAERAPLIDTSDIIGGLWIPQDGVGDPTLVGGSLVQLAREMGVHVVEHCPVTRVVQRDGRVERVEARHGAVSTECQFFVNCGGFWARQIGQLSQPPVRVPLHAVEHYYLHTGPVAGLAEAGMPVVRDMDGRIYVREWDGRLLGGGFDVEARPAFADGAAVPADRRLSADWDHFHALFTELMRRIPSLADVPLERLCNGAEAFSPDCKWILGECPEIQNYLVAAGMKTVGISAAGGVGRAIADHITLGGSPLDLYELDISRFLALHNNRKFLRARAAEVPGMHYALPFPFHEFRTGRQLRMSPIFPAFREHGAVFGETMGYERPNYFDKAVATEPAVGKERSFQFCSSVNHTFGKPDWFDIVASEYAACRERIGLADYSSFTKIDLWSRGREVVDFLQYMCSNDMDVPVGAIVHTGMQNRHGGYENDCSMARLADNHYMMIAPTIQQTRCKTWIERHLHLAGGQAVQLSDVTSMYTAICVLGPFSRRLLAELTDADVSQAAFPFFTFKEIDVGQANGVRAMNLTHTGELGYVLYVPNEFALHVYNVLWEAGRRYGMQHAGHYATRTLRIEKFYAYWGQDLDTGTTPLECGRSWRVKFDKGADFIGREALLRQRDEGVRRMYVQLLLNDHDPDIDMWSWGGEPIFRNGRYCGQTTTTGYGYTFKKQVCLGFVRNLDASGAQHRVTNEFILSGDYEVEIAGIRYPAKVNLHSPLLPSKFPDTERDSYQATRDKPEPPSVVTRKVHFTR